jgi:hypothetical protein
MALKPINIQQKITAKSVKISDIDLQRDSISGDVINGGTITNFSSTGIKDSSTEKRIDVSDETTNIYNDVFIQGKINCQTLQYNKAQVPVLDVKEALRIDGNEVVWRTKLGKSIKESSLNKLGILDDLQVKDTFYVADGRVGINTTVPSKTFAVDAAGVEIVMGSDDAIGFVGTHMAKDFALSTDDTKRLIVASDGKISIEKDLTIKGKVGIGIKNPNHALEVAGDIAFQNRIFSSASSIPTTGTWTRGSIVWNSEPDMGQVVGWICVKGGKPGAWRPFGHID